MTARRALGRGVIEGFYGRPWSHGGRLELVALLAELGLDTYLYAPKNDASHRDRWWEPLSRAELASFGALCEAAGARKVRFVYGVAPERLLGRRNLRIRGETDLDGDALRALVARCRSVAALGVRDFVVLFDDTWPTIAPPLATFAKGRGHALVARRLEEELASAVGDSSVHVVPAIYSGRPASLSRGARRYLEGLASTGPLSVAWTGPRIFSPYIGVRDVEAYREATGLAPWIWDNAVTNDWLPLATGEVVGRRGRERLCFGPVDNVAPELFDRGCAVLVNGSRELEPTRVALVTFAELIARRRAFAASGACGRAIARLYGEHAPAVTALAEVAGGHALVAPQRDRAPVWLERFERARRGHAAERAGLLAELDALATIDAQLAPLAAGERGAELLPSAARVAAAARALAADLRGARGARALLAAAQLGAWATALDPLLAVALKRRRW